MIRKTPLPPDLDRRLPALAERLAREPCVLFAYLFGSLARGQRTPLSDVDVAVHLAADADPVGAKLDLLQLVTDVLGTDEVDLVVLDTAPLMLRHRILQSRIVLADRAPSQRAAFESRTLREAWDFQPRERRILEGRYGLGGG